MLAAQGERVFPERWKILRQTQSLVRELRDRLGDQVTIEVVSPRNAIGFYFLVHTHCTRYRVPWRERLRIAFRGLALGSVIADGRLVTSGRVPAAKEVVESLHSPGLAVASS